MENTKQVAAPAQITAPATPLFVIKDGTVLALAITTVMDKAKSLKNDKGSFTVEYFCEEMLADKLKSFSDYLDANEDRKNRELFTKAMNALATPDMTNPNDVRGYVEAVGRLKLKYRQGASKKEV
jgi:type III secretory pathway component EscR